MQMMVEAGFRTVFIGIETPDEESLAECNKKQNMNRDLIDSVKNLHRAGLKVQGGFIVGFDNDDDFLGKIIADSREFRQCGLAFACE